MNLREIGWRWSGFSWLGIGINVELLSRGDEPSGSGSTYLVSV
jgi:hypothetical protein